MADRDPSPNNPLSPYYPSELPAVPGRGRTWFALLMTALLLSGAAYAVLALLF